MISILSRSILSSPFCLGDGTGSILTIEEPVGASRVANIHIVVIVVIVIIVVVAVRRVVVVVIRC